MGDKRITPSLGTVSFGRLQTLLEAAIIDADPGGAEQQAAAAATERFVRPGRSSEHGLKLIIARAAAGDAIWFKATIDRIADLLARQGDSDSVEVRRSKAIGILAQPAEALQLLCQHQDDGWDGPAEPYDPDQVPAEDDIDRDDVAHNDHAELINDAGHETATGRIIEQGLATSNPASEGTHRSLQITSPPFDPDRARPRAVVYVHLSQDALCAGTGVARVEEVGPVLLGRLRLVLGDRCTINLKPVIDLPAGQTPVDSYEIPASLREQILLRNSADVFPYAAAVGRRSEIDHTIPYVSPDRGGPQGQTRIGNLGPHTRHHHRLKMHGGWLVRQPEPGIWLWRSPHRRIFLVNASGTHPLGDSEFARGIWCAAASPAPALVK